MQTGPQAGRGAPSAANETCRWGQRVRAVKVLRDIEVRKALPYSASGKLLRRELRAELASE